MKVTINDVDQAISAAHWCDNNLKSSDWDIHMCGISTNRWYEFEFTNEQDCLLFSLALQ